MDTLVEVLISLRTEMVVVLATLIAVVLFHYLNKRLGAPGSITLAFLLAFSLAAICMLVYPIRSALNIPISSRAVIFLALYAWCVCAMLFFTSRHTHFFKLFLGLASQAGILYALYVWRY